METVLRVVLVILRCSAHTISYCIVAVVCLAEFDKGPNDLFVTLELPFFR
jgi:hypothetical protein